MGGKKGKVVRNIYNGHMDKIKGMQDRGWKVGMGGQGEVVGGKWRQLYLNNNFKKKKFSFLTVCRLIWRNKTSQQKEDKTPGAECPGDK